jgi:hypothetical protein
MTSRDFAYWLQGFFEISNPETITAEQTQMIQKHLALVFIHEIDPSMGDEKHQDKLNSVHNMPASTIVKKDPFDQQEGEIRYRC